MLGFIYFLFVVAAIVGMVSVVAIIKGRSGSDLKLAKRNLNVAEHALRSIANGAGNPVFEAQDALDKINNYNIKEIA